MNRYAKVVDGTVVNVELWNGENAYPLADELVPCPPDVSVGWSLTDGEWIAPPEPEVDGAMLEVLEARRLARREAAAQLVVLGLSPEAISALVGVSVDELFPPSET